MGVARNAHPFPWTMALLLIATFAMRPALAKEVESQAETRAFDLIYEVVVPPVAAGSGPVDVFIPIARSDEHQDVVLREVRTAMKGEVKVEARYGNRFWHGHLESSDGQELTVAVEYGVHRRVFRRDDAAGSGAELTVGRDLELGAGHVTAPLNYFVYPHVEVAGERFEGAVTTVRYDEDPEAR